MCAGGKVKKRLVDKKEMLSTYKKHTGVIYLQRRGRSRDVLVVKRRSADLQRCHELERRTKLGE